jgi:hypothetical protein
MTKTGWEAVAERLRAEIERRGATPNEIYLQTRVDPKTLEKLLRGEAVRADVRRRLSRYFGWTELGIDQIRNGDEPEGGSASVPTYSPAMSLDDRVARHHALYEALLAQRVALSDEYHATDPGDNTRRAQISLQLDEVREVLEKTRREGVALVALAAESTEPTLAAMPTEWGLLTDEQREAITAEMKRMVGRE